uniref:Uncharacterized protein n=1 Tax=mine drainage metagenome TaxID=410659 RepID=E6QUF9_9ZZZZ
MACGSCLLSFLTHNHDDWQGKLPDNAAEKRAASALNPAGRDPESIQFYGPVTLRLEDGRTERTSASNPTISRHKKCSCSHWDDRIDIANRSIENL